MRFAVAFIRRTYSGLVALICAGGGWYCISPEFEHDPRIYYPQVALLPLVSHTVTSVPRFSAEFDGDRSVSLYVDSKSGRSDMIVMASGLHCDLPYLHFLTIGTRSTRNDIIEYGLPHAGNDSPIQCRITDEASPFVINVSKRQEVFALMKPQHCIEQACMPSGFRPMQSITVGLNSGLTSPIWQYGVARYDNNGSVINGARDLNLGSVGETNVATVTYDIDTKLRGFTFQYALGFYYLACVPKLCMISAANS